MRLGEIRPARDRGLEVEDRLHQAVEPAQRMRPVGEELRRVADGTAGGVVGRDRVARAVEPHQDVAAVPQGVGVAGHDCEQALELGERLVGTVEPQQGHGAPIDEVAVVRRECERGVVARERVGVPLEAVLHQAEVGQRRHGARIAANGGGEESLRLGEAAELPIDAAGEMQDVEIAGVALQRRAAETIRLREVAVAMRRKRLVGETGNVRPLRSRGGGREVWPAHCLHAVRAHAARRRGRANHGNV